MQIWKSIYEENFKKIKYIEPNKGAIFNIAVCMQYMAVYYENSDLEIFDTKKGRSIYSEPLSIQIQPILEWENKGTILRIKNPNLEIIKEYTILGECVTETEYPQKSEHTLNNTLEITINNLNISAIGRALIIEDNNNNKKEIITEHKSIRIIKPLKDNRFFTCGSDNVFVIWEVNDLTVESVFVGYHNNWVLDVHIDNGIIYSTGIDSFVKKWDLKTNLALGILPLKRGWIYSLQVYDDHLYVGTQFGDIYVINVNKINSKGYNEGAIWNIIQTNDKVITVSEGGQIVIRNASNGDIINTLKFSDGWVNNIVFSKKLSKFIAVTSRGEIILIENTDNNDKYVSHLFDLWFNSLTLVGHYVYVVSAEGKLVVFDLEKEIEVQRIQLSRYQLIDIVYDKTQNCVIAASVEGELFEISCMDFSFSAVAELENKHFTSIAFDQEEMICFISSLEGEIIQYSTKTKEILNIKKLHAGRVWKVSVDSKQKRISTISTDKIVRIWGYCFSKIYNTFKPNELMTTCALYGEKLYLGNEKGETHCFYISDNVMEVEKVQEVNLNNIITPSLDVTDSFNFCDGIYLFIDKKSPIYQTYMKRDIEILEYYDYEYTLIDVTFDEKLKSYVVTRSGWSKFPQILFWGKFISSASVISEMHETRTLKRVEENISRS